MYALLLQAWANQYTFVVFLVLMVGFTVFLYVYVPETKNKTVDEIASELSSRRSKDRKTSDYKC